MIKHTKFRLALIALFAAIGQSSIQAEFINTFPAWDGSSYVYPFGETDTATYGQTITTGATDTVLQDFSFLIRTTTVNPSRFEAYVMAWDSVNSRATGSVLYQTGMYTNAVGPVFSEIFVPVGVNLNPNSEYVLFFSASNVFDGNEDAADFAYVGEEYAGGDFVYINNSNDFSLVNTASWVTNHLGGVDLAFKANLTAVPEPASWALIAGGLAIVGVKRLRRKRAIV
jgi:hypothetical protein